MNPKEALGFALLAIIAFVLVAVYVHAHLAPALRRQLKAAERRAARSESAVDEMFAAADEYDVLDNPLAGKIKKIYLDTNVEKRRGLSR